MINTQQVTTSIPWVSQILFHDKRSAWLWLIVRVYVGWQWLEAGLGKVFNDAWTGDNAGQALRGFLEGAIAKSSGLHPAVQSWYALFLQTVVLPNAEIWSYFVAWGEVLVGVGLVLGILVSTAAFFGGFMNFNYLLAGTVGINPILLMLSVGIILAYRISGQIGLRLITKYFNFFKLNRRKNDNRF